MVCGDRSGDAAYGKNMKFIHYPKRYPIQLKHILPISVNIFQKWFAVIWGGLRWFGVVCGGLRWFAVVCGNSTVPFFNIVITIWTEQLTRHEL